MAVVAEAPEEEAVVVVVVVVVVEVLPVAVDFFCL